MLKVRKQSLLLIAGIVWILAGFSVARIGLIEYRNHFSVLFLLLSIVIFSLFGMMFFHMSKKHIRRILNYEEEYHFIFRFFDIKSYCIMIFMMTGGITLRQSGLVSMGFIAFFYTGLGLALMLAGLVFIRKYSLYNKEHIRVES